MSGHPDARSRNCHRLVDSKSTSRPRSSVDELGSFGTTRLARCIAKQRFPEPAIDLALPPGSPKSGYKKVPSRPAYEILAKKA